MAQYIDKSAVVAEIKRRIKALHSTLNERETAVKFELKDFLSFLNTLEVKEVDLNESARYYLLHEHISPLNEVLHQADIKVEMQYHKDIEDAYKAGFELGLKAQKGDSLWISVEEQPLPYGIDVLAYNKEWVNEWTPNGIRIGYLSEEGFVSAKYSSCDEDYITCREDGDDYDTWQEQSDGSVKTWYNNDGDIKEGYRPNMPTHYIVILNCKAQKGE